MPVCVSQDVADRFFCNVQSIRVLFTFKFLSSMYIYSVYFLFSIYTLMTLMFVNMGDKKQRPAAPAE